MKDITEYLAGERLYGDDFSLDEIKEWYEDEQEGYAELGAKNKGSYQYSYHALNSLHGYSSLKDRKFKRVLGFGSAYGDEFLPIIGSIESLAIIDPSDAFSASEVHGVQCTYVKPSIDGSLPFEDGEFDLIVCLGVLHHIPNVTDVVKELYRCLAGDGFILLREPIISMGDWSKPRSGLTKRERGIPLRVFRRIIAEAGFEVTRETLCMFPGIAKIWARFGRAPYNSALATWMDAGLSKLFKWNIRYHPRNIFHKFRPSSVYWVLRKVSV